VPNAGGGGVGQEVAELLEMRRRKRIGLVGRSNGGRGREGGGGGGGAPWRLVDRLNQLTPPCIRPKCPRLAVVAAGLGTTTSSPVDSHGDAGEDAEDDWSIEFATTTLPAVLKNIYIFFFVLSVFNFASL
jgi:hypothetical protein